MVGSSIETNSGRRRLNEVCVCMSSVQWAFFFDRRSDSLLGKGSGSVVERDFGSPHAVDSGPNAVQTRVSQSKCIPIPLSGITGGVHTFMCFYFVRVFQLAGLVAASTAAEASNEALQAMLAQDHGAEGGVLDAWLTLSAHKVCCKAAPVGVCPSLPFRNNFSSMTNWRVPSDVA